MIRSVPIGTASECLNEWADEDAGIEAVQRILDALDDVAALQDSQIDPDVLISMLRDSKLHAILQVGTKQSFSPFNVRLLFLQFAGSGEFVVCVSGVNYVPSFFRLSYSRIVILPLHDKQGRRSNVGLYGFFLL